MLVLACGSQEPPAGPLHAITGVALAGPICPVETDPPDPACAPRPVAGAGIEVLDESGEVIAEVVTAQDGTFTVMLPDGLYSLVPQPVEGLLGTAAPVEVSVAGADVEVEPLLYDTGIR